MCRATRIFGAKTLGCARDASSGLKCCSRETPAKQDQFVSKAVLTPLPGLSTGLAVPVRVRVQESG